MEQQLSFFSAPKRRPLMAGWPARGAHSVVTYFAVLPPDEIRQAMIRLRQATVARERIFGRPVAPERLHISLAPLMRCHPNDMPDFAQEVEPLADGIVAQAMMPAFDVVFDRVQTFNSKDRDEAHRRYYLVVDGADLPGLMRLNDLFRQAFIKSGSNVAMPGAFNPHLTLFYANRPIAPRDIAPIRWTVRDMALVHSFRGSGRYEVVRRWRLAAR
jgi:RNA 2',3'-cyclic 3'-phosphodiesterase